MSGCQKCGCAPCCCTPCKTDVCATKPSCLGVEDLCLGCGETTQYRNGRKTQITQINSDHIQFCGKEGATVTDYIKDLRRMFPYIECDLGRPTMDYGNWLDAFIAANIDSCAIGLPGTTDQRIPFKEGDVTKHNGCLWISLINNNLVEPTEATENEKKWLCLSKLDKRIDDLETCCAQEDHVVNFQKIGDKYRITMKKGGTFEVAIPVTNPNDGLPAGAVTFVDHITGTFSVVADGTPDWNGATEYPTDATVANWDYYEFNCSEKTFTVADYPYLGTVGKKVVLSMVSSVGYWVVSDTAKDTLRKIGPYQWGTAAYINGTRVKEPGDAYGLNRSGHNAGLSDTSSFEFVTNGHDLVVKACGIFIAMNDDAVYHQGDSMEVDMGTTTITFNASSH